MFTFNLFRQAVQKHFPGAVVLVDPSTDSMRVVWGGRDYLIPRRHYMYRDMTEVWDQLCDTLHASPDDWDEDWSLDDPA